MGSVVLGEASRAAERGETGGGVGVSQVLMGDGGSGDVQLAGVVYRNQAVDGVILLSGGGCVDTMTMEDEMV